MKSLYKNITSLIIVTLVIQLNVLSMQDLLKKSPHAEKYRTSYFLWTPDEIELVKKLMDKNKQLPEDTQKLKLKMTLHDESGYEQFIDILHNHKESVDSYVNGTSKSNFTVMSSEYLKEKRTEVETNIKIAKEKNAQC